MSDFRVQYISGRMPAGTAQLLLTAPADFAAVGSLASAFTLPATNMPTVGVSDPALTSEMRRYLINCNLSAANQITLTRGEGSDAADYAFYIIEYVGVPGGPNEFIMRHRTVFPIAEGATTAQSAGFSGVSSLQRTVPFVTGRFDTASSSALRNFLPEASIVVDGSNHAFHLERTLTGGEPRYVCYAVEFTGSNWDVRAGQVGPFTQNADTDFSISASISSLSKFWLHAYYRPGNRDTPAGGTWFANMATTSVLRVRTIEFSSLSRLRYYVITNSDAAFSSHRVDAVNGTNDWLAGASPQAQSIATNPTPEAGTFVVGQAGSTSTDLNANPAGLWRFRRLGLMEAQAYRARSVGDTEYRLQVISLPADTAVSRTVAPAPAGFTLSTGVVSGPLLISPGLGVLNWLTFPPFSEVSRTPATAVLLLQGGQVITSVIYPAPASLSLDGRAATQHLTKVITPAIPDLDYAELPSNQPTIIIGTLLQPDAAIVTLQSLDMDVFQGGNIRTIFPDVALVSFIGSISGVAINPPSVGELSVIGLEPEIVATHGLVEPGVGVVEVTSDNPLLRPRVHIPFQWLEYDPGRVVSWS